MKAIQTTAIVVLLVASSAVPLGAAAATSQQADAYSGTHVSFESTESALVDYSVDGRTVLDSVSVQSRSAAESQGSLAAGVSLSAVTALAGSALTFESQSEVSATLTAESGAEMTAHDNGHGILVVSSGSESQYVTVNVSGDADTESESDQRLVVTDANGTQGTFVVVGDGEVTANEQGNVSAALAGESKLVFRSYAEERTEDDRQQERLIADGQAAAEVYVTESSESSGEFAADVVQYGEDTSVEVTQSAEGTVNVTAERSQSAGRIILTTVSEQAIGSTENLSVTVDGNAAAEASSYGELESAIGGNSSRYMASQSSGAEASTEVLVAVNQFSTRELSITGNGSGNGGLSGVGPGFGVVAALVAVLAGIAVAVRRRE